MPINLSDLTWVASLGTTLSMSNMRPIMPPFMPFIMSVILFLLFSFFSDSVTSPTMSAECSLIPILCMCRTISFGLRLFGSKSEMLCSVGASAIFTRLLLAKSWRAQCSTTACFRFLPGDDVILRGDGAGLLAMPQQVDRLSLDVHLDQQRLKAKALGGSVLSAWHSASVDAVATLACVLE